MYLLVRYSQSSIFRRDEDGEDNKDTTSSVFCLFDEDEDGEDDDDVDADAENGKVGEVPWLFVTSSCYTTGSAIDALVCSMELMFLFN